MSVLAKRLNLSQIIMGETMVPKQQFLFARSKIPIIGVNDVEMDGRYGSRRGCTMGLKIIESVDPNRASLRHLCHLEDREI